LIALEGSSVVSLRIDTSTLAGRSVVFSIAGILALHILVLATTRAPLGESLPSQILQSISVLLACALAGAAALRSHDFARTFWGFASSGFALLLVAVVRRYFEHGEGFGISDYLFLLYMAPWGLMLLLNEHSPPNTARRWILILDYSQILVVALVLFIALIYIPSKYISGQGATPSEFHFLYATFSVVLITRNVSVTIGFWFRTLASRSERERSAFRLMAIYLLIYTAGSVLTHYIFLLTRSQFVWIDLEGTLPFLAGAFLFLSWRDRPKIAQSETRESRQALTPHLIPAILPMMVAAFAMWIAQSEPHIAWIAVASSMSIFALRLLATIRSEHGANEATREGEERYRSLALATAQVIWTTNSRGEMVAGQPMWTSFTGMNQQEIFGRGWLNAVHPEDRKLAIAAEQSACENRNPYDFECRLRRHDGAYRCMSVRRVPVLGIGGEIREWVGTCADVTDRKLSDQALRQSQERYRSFFEQNLAGNYITTPDGVLLKCNPAFLRMFGFDSEEEAKQADFAFSYRTREDHEQFVREVAVQGQVEYHQEVFHRRDGTPLYVTENAIGTFGEDGRLVEIQGFLIDETERRKSEQQLLHAQKMEIVGRLAGGISHDFNNFLSVINGYSEVLLANPELEEPIRSDLQEIHDAGRRAALLTNRLLTFSRTQVLQPRAVSLNVIIEDIDKTLSHLIGEDIEFRTVLAPNLQNVDIDPSQMEQIILNFCVNARDAMPTGGTITLETANLEITPLLVSRYLPLKAGRYVRLDVSDTGTGMDKATLSRVFEPFFTTKGPEKGTGLGLATVWAITIQNGGHVWVTSDLGKGTTFSVCLPATMEKVQLPEKEFPSVEAVGGTETILVVEDVAPLRVLTRRSLEQTGYKVLEAEDGEQAIHVADEYGGSISLLLTDVLLPKIRGPVLANILRQKRNGIRTLYMSGYSGNALLGSEALKAGEGFIMKPFTAAALAKKVREVLDTPPDKLSPSDFAA
jgi:two-component system cell cycle sensor histidine kinase/response regulator CckA